MFCIVLMYVSCLFVCIELRSIDKENIGTRWIVSEMFGVDRIRSGFVLSMRSVWVRLYKVSFFSWGSRHTLWLVHNLREEISLENGAGLFVIYVDRWQSHHHFIHIKKTHF